MYSEKVYGIPPEQVAGTAAVARDDDGQDGQPTLTDVPALLLNDNHAGKRKGMHLMIGRRPSAAFGNSTNYPHVLKSIRTDDGARLAMRVLHDDARREITDCPAQGLPATKIGTGTQALDDEATKQGWTVLISMSNVAKKVFAPE